MYRTGLAIGLAVLAAACGPPPEQSQNNAAASDIEVLPPDESVATPTEDLANGAVEQPPAGNAAEVATAIPAALHGRWGLTANDCQPGRSDAKGLVTVSADRIGFYESVARPQTIRTQTGTSIAGEFAFTGEGMNWTSPMIWSVEDGKLVRIDSERDSRLVYTRC